MSRLTMDEIWKKRGNIVNTETGEIVADPPAWTPILAGPWPNPNVGCRQANCSNCHRFVGMSPKGWTFHLVNPLCRPIFCEFCFRVLADLVSKMNAPAPQPPELPSA